MPENAAARIVSNARLTLSRAPAAALAAGAVQALTDLKTRKRTPPGADYVLVAVPPGTADAELAAELERAADAHITAATPLRGRQARSALDRADGEVNRPLARSSGEQYDSGSGNEPTERMPDGKPW